MRHRMAKLFLPVAVAMLLLPTLAAAVELRWGVGWEDAPTLRCRIDDKWQAGVSFSPSRGEGLVERSYFDGEAGPQYSQFDEVPVDREQWSGFAGLNLSRSIVRDGRFDLAVFTCLQYQWLRSDETNEDLNYTEWRFRRYENDVDSWTFAIGLRPSFELLDRATVVFTFGYSAFWDDGIFTETRWTHSPDSEYRKISEYSGGKFQTWGGWDGLASVGFVFWL